MEMHEDCAATGAKKQEALWNVTQTAEYLNCSESWVYKAAQRDELPSLPIGSMIRFDPDEIRAYARRARDKVTSRVAKKREARLFSASKVPHTAADADVARVNDASDAKEQ